MHKPYWLSGLLLIFLGLTACTPKAKGLLGKKQSANLLIDKPSSAAKYELCYMLDPYNGGTYIHADTTFNPGLFFFNNGEFVEFDRYNFYEGKWNVSSEKDLISFLYQRKNFKDRPEENSPQKVYWNQQYQLIKTTQDTLIIGARGRHGMVKKVYIKVPLTQ
ncbi:MAG: hypothetical protein AAFY71_11975 [Bacteroidota bacterium]